MAKQPLYEITDKELHRIIGATVYGVYVKNVKRARKWRPGTEVELQRRRRICPECGALMYDTRRAYKRGV